MNLNRVYLPRPEDIKERWQVIDAAGQTVGRIASEIAKIMRGKNLVISTPSVKTGPRVIVLNAAKVVFSGDKMENKVYRKYTGYRGNCKHFTANEAMHKDPTYVLEHAIKGMLRRNRLERQLLKSIRIYADANHEQKAQVNRN